MIWFILTPIFLFLGLWWHIHLREQKEIEEENNSLYHQLKNKTDPKYKDMERCLESINKITDKYDKVFEILPGGNKNNNDNSKLLEEIKNELKIFIQINPISINQNEKQLYIQRLHEINHFYQLKNIFTYSWLGVKDQFDKIDPSKQITYFSQFINDLLCHKHTLMGHAYYKYINLLFEVDDFSDYIEDFWRHLYILKEAEKEEIFKDDISSEANLFLNKIASDIRSVLPDIFSWEIRDLRFPQFPSSSIEIHHTSQPYHLRLHIDYEGNLIIDDYQWKEFKQSQIPEIENYAVNTVSYCIDCNCLPYLIYFYDNENFKEDIVTPIISDISQAMATAIRLDEGKVKDTA